MDACYKLFCITHKEVILNGIGDRRVRRTRSLLFGALVTLLEERPFKEISIKDLTERADIARPTFYRNYDSLQAILIEELDFRAANFLDEISDIISECKTFNEITTILFSRWNDNSELFMAMYRAEMDNLVLERFTAYAEGMIRIVNRDPDDDIYMPRMNYFAGGAHNLFKNWLIGGRTQPIAEMADIMANDLFPLVKTTTLTLQSSA